MRARAFEPDRKPTPWRTTAAALLLTLALAACGEADDPDAAGDAGGTPPATSGPAATETAAGTETAAETPTEAGTGTGTEAAGGDGMGCGPVEEGTTVPMYSSPSGVAAAVAQEEGLFDGVELDITLVGFGEQDPLFLSGQMPVAQIAPFEVAQYIAEGEDVKYFSTTMALNFVNGIIIRAEDAEEYQTISDLQGATIGQPGFDSGTWTAFETLARELYDLEAREDFEVTTAEPGALLGLLSTGEIDAALNFAGQVATGIARPEFELLISFTDMWEEETGHPLVVTGLVAYTDWLEENTAVACRLVEGIDRGVEWMKDNPDEFREGGKYADWVEGEGWLADPETNDAVIDLLQDGRWYMTHDLYTEEWMDSAYQFAELAVDADGLPAKEEIFFPPDQLAGGS